MVGLKGARVARIAFGDESSDPDHFSASRTAMPFKLTYRASDVNRRFTYIFDIQAFAHRIPGVA
jgi:hypothetical protein